MEKTAFWVGILSNILQAVPVLGKFAPGARLQITGTDMPYSIIYKYARNREYREEVTESQVAYRTTTPPGVMSFWHEDVYPVDDEEYQFAVIAFENKPILPIEYSTAKNVRAIISYRGGVKEPVIEGRFWQHGREKRIPEPEEMDSVTVIEELPNGTEAQLAIAMKSPKERIIFAYNADCNELDEWRNRDFVLGSKVIHVEVRFRGENFRDKVENFELTRSSGNELIIKHIIKDKKK